MSRELLRNRRERGGRSVTIALPFDDIMEFALVLLSAPPAETEELDWSFADRKRLLDHFLRSEEAARKALLATCSARP